MTTKHSPTEITLSSLEHAQSLRLSQAVTVAQPAPRPTELTITLASLDRAQSSLRFARQLAGAA